jgi:hypothetical protein
MSYALSFDESPAAAVEAVRREQFEAAAEGLGDDPTDAEAIHDARKRLKTTRALLRLALKRKAFRTRNRGAAPPKLLKAQAKEAKKLSKLLGEDHDLAVLADTLRTDPQLKVLSADLLDVIAERRAKVLKRSRALGKRVYAEKPKAFARRFARYVELA